MGDLAAERRRDVGRAGVIESRDRLEQAGRASVRRRLTVGAADDPAELEADQVADQVVSRLGDQAHVGSPIQLAGSDRLRRASTGSATPSSVEVGADGGELTSETTSAIQSARGGGSALPEALGGQMQTAFGADFSDVRVHDDSRSHELNRSMQAQAFTAGSDIFLGAEAPSIETSKGTHLLAHELTHVVQNTGGARRSLVPGITPVGGAPGRIRRMPSAQKLKERTGKKSSTGYKIFGGKGATTHYNAILDALDAYRNYMMNTAVGDNPGTVKSQLDSIKTRLDNILKACQEYLTKEKTDPLVVQEITAIQKQAGPERFQAEQVGNRFAKKGRSIAGNPKWLLAMPGEGSKAYTDMEVTETNDVGQSSGQQKSVSKVTNAEGKTGYFAKDDQYGKYDEIETNENSMMVGFSKYTGAESMLGNYGNKEQDLRLGKRSVAMSRVDQLLKAGVIAKTEFAFKNGQFGTFMDEAKGETGLQAAATRPAVKDDPNLARLLSRLHLIDLLCGQVDRHDENYYVQFDTSGNVVGVTGIDLDMSFVENTGRQQVSIEKGSHDKGGATDKLPGLAMYVDKELAERIIALDPKDLAAILEDLLTGTQIQAALGRLNDLQVALKKMKSEGKLLDPKQWGQAQRQGLRDEHEQRRTNFSKEGQAKPGSYFGRVTTR